MSWSDGKLLQLGAPPSLGGKTTGLAELRASHLHRLPIGGPGKHTLKLGH